MAIQRIPATYFSNFTGRVGNLSRNYAIGPGFFEVQARVSKMFTFGRYRLDIYGEAFNLLNSVNLGNPNGNLRSSHVWAVDGARGKSTASGVRLPLQLLIVFTDLIRRSTAVQAYVA